MKILHLISIDGRSTTLKILKEISYPTHVELDVECIASFPPSDLIGNQFKIVTADYRPYVITGFRYSLFIPKQDIEVIIVSGSLGAYKGYAYISYELPSTIFFRKLSGEEKEVYFKNLYETLRLELSTLKTRINECYENRLNLAEELHREYSRLLDKYIEFYKKAVGLASPETQVLIESLLATTPIAPPAPQAQPTPQPTQPRKGLLQRIRESLAKIFKRSKP